MLPKSDFLAGLGPSEEALNLTERNGNWSDYPIGRDDLAEVGWLPPQTPLHSDRGCHYTSRACRTALASMGISKSMSRKGNCWDNAPMESWFGHAKDEIPLRGRGSFEEARAAVAGYVDYYNRDRPQPGLGGMTPGREEGVPPGQAADAARGHQPTGKRKRARQRCLARSWMLALFVFPLSTT